MFLELGHNFGTFLIQSSTYMHIPVHWEELLFSNSMMSRASEINTVTNATEINLNFSYQTKCVNDLVLYFLYKCIRNYVQCIIRK